MMDMAELGLGTVGESIRTGGIVAMLLVVMRFYLANRKLKMEARKDDRQGYGDLIDKLKAQIADIYSKLDQCERERESDREEMKGLRDQFLAYQLALVERIPDLRKSDEIMAMTRSLRGVLEAEEKGKAE